jgi:hypothetical protein
VALSNQALLTLGVVKKQLRSFVQLKPVRKHELISGQSLNVKYQFEPSQPAEAWFARLAWSGPRRIGF